MRNAHILICGIVLILAVFLPNVAADNDSMKLLLTLDQKDYSSGDTGKVTVHVFDKGEYVESDEIPNCTIKAGDYSDEIEREITLEKKSTGIYESDFKIFTSDADDFDRMTIYGDATYGKSDETDTEYNMDDDSQSFNPRSSDDTEEEVSVTIINAPVSAFPGDTFTLRIEVEKGGGLADADDLDIKYELAYEEDGPDEDDLPYDKVGTGIYEATMEVPKNIKESCSIDIEAEATIYGESDSDFESVKIDFLSVWYNKGSVGQTMCTFDVYVADADGKAVSDADIKLNWDEAQRSSGKDATKLTDSSGKASFEITYEEDTYSLEIGGKVLKDGKTQYFSGEIELKEDGEEDGDWDEPDDYGMDVVLKKDSLSGKSPYTLECRVFLDGQRISKKEVYYYLYNDVKVIAHGAVTTDIDGEFSFKFSYSTSGSYDSIQAYFETVYGDYEGWSWDDRENTLDGKEYAYETENIWFESDDLPNIDFDDSSIKISVEKLKRGGLTEVTVTGIPEDFMPYISWVPASVNSVQDIEEWENRFGWEQWGGEGLMAQGTSISSGKGTTKLMIPEFMPSGKYTIFAGYVDTSGINEPDFSLEDAYHINNVIVEPGKSGTSTETTDSSLFSSNGFIMLSVGILVIILVVIIVIILMVKRKKRKTVSEVVRWDEADYGYPPPAESHTTAPGTTHPMPQENIPSPPVKRSHENNNDESNESAESYYEGYTMGVSQREQYPPPTRQNQYQHRQPQSSAPIPPGQAMTPQPMVTTPQVQTPPAQPDVQEQKALPEHRFAP